MKRSKIIGIAYRNGEEEDIGWEKLAVTFETHMDYLKKGPRAVRNVRSALQRAGYDWNDIARIEFEAGEPGFGFYSDWVEAF